MKKTFAIIAFATIVLSSTHCQETISGSVCDGDTKQGIPYAAIHLKGTCIGSSCNESGQFSLHVPQGRENGQAVVSSLGYASDTIAVRTLIKNGGRVILQPNPIQLSDATVVEYATARKLMDAVIERIPQNYRTADAIGIWHCRNRQMLNDSLFVKSEGLSRNYMPAYGYAPEVEVVRDSSERKDAWYRFYQSLDTVMVYNMPYWRSLIGPEDLDRKLNIEKYNKPSILGVAATGDFVNYMRNKKLRIFSRKSKFMMETFSQDGTDYYRVTIAYRPRLARYCDTAIIIINKDELAIVDATVVRPMGSYLPSKEIMQKYTYHSDILHSFRIHCRYHKYNGKYQLDFVRHEYEDRFEFTPKAEMAGCQTPYLKVNGWKEHILSEHTYEGVDEYKRRYFDNKHPRTEENIKETERILREPHNKIPW